jgi:hypothetical protein
MDIGIPPSPIADTVIVPTLRVFIAANLAMPEDQAEPAAAQQDHQVVGQVRAAEA